ncbi:hypothetical protein [Saccharibacillus sacchari]|uniref:Uncharacterized protein n=1 Tax=Saccharibacillus sacchari TaxID=456493 RepID=A0ACC6PCQ9_9BACL
MQSDQQMQQFSDVLEEVNFILYGSKKGKSDEELETEREQQAEISVR